MRDEALLPFQHLMEKLTDIDGEIINDENGIHSHIYQFEIEMPIELEILKNEGEGVQIGSAPPLYYIDTTFKPSYHNIRFTAIKYEPEYGY